jgi:hypothetical protein
MRESLVDVGWFTPFKVRLVKDRLDSAKVTWAFFAGFAAYCYGSRRPLTDIDVLVLDREFGKASAALGRIEGVELCRTKPKTILGKTYAMGMDDEMAAHIVRRTFFGIEVPLISPEDNVLLKAISQRGPERGKHDVDDIIATALSEKMDVEYLASRIAKFGAEERATSILKKLKIL